MKVTLAMLCVLASSVAGFSQEKSFNLNHYKFPDYKRHELELNFTSSGFNNKETSQTYLSPGEIEKKENSRINNSTNLTLGYKYDYLTRKRIDYLYTTFTGDYQYSKNNNNNHKEIRSNPSIRLNLNGSSKYYLIENKFFLEGFTDLNYNWDKLKTTATNTPDDISSDNFEDLSVGLGIGVGRIEKVSDLWQAYYMLEKLNKQGSFNRQMTEDDVFEFARLASRLKNKRFFDARLHKIEELKGLDSLLHQQGLVRESDISYFTTLNDYWSYGNFQDRQSGMELVFHASPNYARVYQKMDDIKARISNRSTIELSGMFNYVKQLNLYWEQRIVANVSYESLLDSTGHYFYNTPDNKLFTYASLGYGYFPDSRTSISGSIRYQGYNIFIPNQQNTTDDSWVNRVYLSLSGYYYLSPQLQITGNISYSYVDRDYNTLDRSYMNYSLGLRYAIF